MGKSKDQMEEWFRSEGLQSWSEEYFGGRQERVWKDGGVVRKVKGVVCAGRRRMKKKQNT